MTRCAVRVLHLASFTGNIGDNANHAGFRPWFEAMIGRDVEWEELEIREFYWSERKFDRSFVEMAGSVDLVIIGGGNYFELWVEDSPTGTSIAIEPDLLAEIKTPIFFNAVGVDPGQGATQVTVDRFRRFLESLNSRPDRLVSVRNDGSMDALRSVVGREWAEEVQLLPDHGFFAPLGTWKGEGTGQIGINVACDMQDVRFREFGGGSQGYLRFCKEFASALGTILLADERLEARFFPHIFRDLKVVHDILECLPDRLRRTRLTVAPYELGWMGAQTVFGQYAECEMLLSMRFHASVCAINLGSPTVGLATYRQIEKLYEELEDEDGCVNVGRPGFTGELVSLVQEVMASPAKRAERVRRLRAEVLEQRRHFEPTLSAWLERLSLA